MVNIQTATIIDVTGTMGANVAGIFASFGGAKVFCVGRDIKKVKKTILCIVKSLKQMLSKRIVFLQISLCWKNA